MCKSSICDCAPFVSVSLYLRICELGCLLSGWAAPKVHDAGWAWFSDHFTWGNSDCDWLANKLPCLRLFLRFFFSSVFQLLCFSPAFCFPLFQLSVFPPFFCPFRLCFCFVCRCPVSVRLFVCLFVCLPFVCAGGLRKGIPNILQRARQRNWIEMIRGLWVVGRGRNAMKSDYWRCCFMFYACPPSLCSRPVPLSLSLSCEWSTHGTQIIMQKNIYLIDTARGFEWGRGWILHTFLITYFSLWAAKKKSLHLTRFFEALKQGLTVLPYGSCETRRPWAEAQFF